MLVPKKGAALLQMTIEKANDVRAKYRRSLKELRTAQEAWERNRPDRAEVTNRNGGIDFNSKYLQMNIQGDGTITTLPFFQGVMQ